MTRGEAYSARAVARWRRELRAYARPAPDADLPRSALLVVDMQRYFAGICAPIVGRVAATVEACRVLGVPVIFTQHGHADPTLDGGMLGEWWGGDLIGEGTDEHALIDVGARPGDPIVAKRRYDAFFGTELAALLRERGTSDLAVAGVMTNLCVETTARQAFVRDLRVRVLLDCTATASEELHLSALRNLAYGFAHVQTAEEWLAGLRRRARG